jgi:predicted small integral membrane protein
MTLRNMFLINSILMLLFALGLLLGAPTVLGMLKVKTGAGEALVAQMLGAAFLVPALLGWFARDVTDPSSAAAVVVPMFLFYAVAFVVMLLGVLAKSVGPNGWLMVVLFAALALGFGYFQFVRQSAV